VCDASAKSGNQCTLRAAIQEANANNNDPTVDTINFAIGGRATVKTINVVNEDRPGNVALPSITEAVTINGYTQRGAKENTLAEGNNAVLKVQLNGSNTSGPAASGLEIFDASNCTIKGLVINRFDGHGIIIRGSGAQFNKVEGNFIGTNAKGTTDLGNDDNGVIIAFALNNTIGGTQPAQRNVISGNGNDNGGVAIQAGSATGNKVMGNFIGTNAKGTADLGNGGINGGNGVVITSVPGNTIGGTASGAGNVISGNSARGVQISGSEATLNKVEGNRIGTTADGTGDLGNDEDGVFIGAPNNTIGGTEAGARNTISGNGDDGITILNSVNSGGATGNQVLGNRIGIEADGSGSLGNDDDGVSIAASNNTIGGTASGAGNAISANGDDGVEINETFGNEPTGNRVLSNFIFSNGGLGIDLVGTDGVTANDPAADKDSDTGANNLQNFPVISSAIKSNTTPFLTTITGTLNSNPNQTYTIQCFVAVPDPSGHGEGQIPVDQDTVQTDAGGEAEGADRFSCVSPIPQVGQAVTVTATNTATGDTSEFSLNKTVVAGP
jgi:hypothetical protein